MKAGRPSVARRTLTPEDVATRLKRSVKTVYELLSRGDIPSRRVGNGRMIRVRERDLRKYLAASESRRRGAAGSTVAAAKAAEISAGQPPRYAAGGETVEYRTLARFPGRTFGSDGSIWSLYNGRHVGVEWRRVYGSSTSDGYRVINLGRGSGRGKRQYVHSLICEAFHGPRPPGMECRHLDDDGENNRPDNLAWGMSAENKADALRNGRRALGARNGRSKLNWPIVDSIREETARGEKPVVLARKHGVDPKAIRLILAGINWRPETRPADIGIEQEITA